MEEKIVCFTKYAAYVDPIVLDKVGLKTKYFFRIKDIFQKLYESAVSHKWRVVL